MATRKVNIYYSGIRDMLQSSLIAQELGLRAQRAEAYARAIAPRGATREYENSFYTRVSRTDGGFRRAGDEVIHERDRATAYLGNDDPNAFQIEVGTKDTPAHHTLRRAATEAMGD
jgi:hypothetical protein